MSALKAKSLFNLLEYNNGDKNSSWVCRTCATSRPSPKQASLTAMVKKVKYIGEANKFILEDTRNINKVVNINNSRTSKAVSRKLIWDNSFIIKISHASIKRTVIENGESGLILNSTVRNMRRTNVMILLMRL